MSDYFAPEVTLEIEENDPEISLELEGEDPEINLEVDFEATIGGVKSYRKLEDKPSINGTELYDNYDEIDPTVPEWSKEPTKPSYSYEDTGAVGGENQMNYDEIDRMFNAVFGI